MIALELYGYINDSGVPTVSSEPPSDDRMRIMGGVKVDGDVDEETKNDMLVELQQQLLQQLNDYR